MRHGFLLIAKPEGPTSHDIVLSVRTILHEPKVGHLGTLDPAASGLLVLAVGAKALKVIELFEDSDKSYEARIVFGYTSATYDREGPIEEVPEKSGWSPPTDVQLQETLRKHFLGDISQVPPPRSAVHIAGERACTLVRRNHRISLALPPRNVKVTKLQLISYAYPHACIHIECSAGTYIRSLVHDLGQLLRCGAYLEHLKRLRVGDWKLEDACHVEIPDVKLQASKKFQAPGTKHPTISWACVIPLKEALQNFPRLDLTEEQWEDVRNGRSIACRVDGEPTLGWFDGLPVAILERDRKDSSKAHPRKVF